MSELGSVIFGFSRDGKLCLSTHERHRLMLALTQCSGAIEIVIRKPSKKRSQNQNKYYWGVVLKLIAQYSGHTEQTLHKRFKEKFLTPDASTSKLGTKEFEEYLEKIRAEVAPNNIIIPDPERVDSGEDN